MTRSEGHQAELQACWEAWDAGKPLDDVSAYLMLARDALRNGDITLAFDVTQSGLDLEAEHPGLMLTAATALARCGSTGLASRYVERLLTLLASLPAADQAGAGLVDALSLRGRIAKDQWSKQSPGSRREQLGLLARDAYARAYELTQDYFPAINAATMSYLIGDRTQGQPLAEVIVQRWQAQAQQQPENYWLQATLGEARLLLGDEAGALDSYQRAGQAAAGRYGDLASMRRQLSLLRQVLTVPDAVLSALAIPRVAVFTGHMIDAPGRTTPRFPDALAPAVAAALAEQLRLHQVGIGYVSLACGGDILFAEALLDQGAELNVVLPFQRDEFVAISVAFAGPDWVTRFDRVLQQAHSVTYACEESYLGDDILFHYAATTMFGMARLRASQLTVDPLLLAVLEPGAPAAVGGTADMIHAWQQHGLEARVLDLAGLRRRLPPEEIHAPAPTGAPPSLQPGSPSATPRSLKTMLFADVVGFSKLQEKDAPAFFSRFLGEIAQLLAEVPIKPVFVNTWGDGLYVVFDEARDGADFALRVRDLVRDTDWVALALPPGLAIRIGVHTGPVFPAWDPIVQRPNFFGSHVNRAARIEPVTSPGSVFASEQAAAYLLRDEDDGFACDYLGTMALAKGYGRSRLYRLRRSADIE